MKLDSKYSKSGDPSIHSTWSAVVDEERMGQGHWFGSVLCSFFSVLTQLLGCRRSSAT